MYLSNNKHFCTHNTFHTKSTDTRCLTPVPLEGAKYNVSKWIGEGLYLPGTELTFTCDDGLTLTPDDFDKRVCQENGLWSYLATGVKERCVPGISLKKTFIFKPFFLILKVLM